MRDLRNLKFWSLAEEGSEGYFSKFPCDNKACPHDGHLSGKRYDCVGIDTTKEGKARLRIGESNRVEVGLCESCMVDLCS